TRSKRDWSSDVCSSDLLPERLLLVDRVGQGLRIALVEVLRDDRGAGLCGDGAVLARAHRDDVAGDVGAVLGREVPALEEAEARGDLVLVLVVRGELVELCRELLIAEPFDRNVALAASDGPELSAVAGLAGVLLALDRSCHGDASWSVWAHWVKWAASERQRTSRLRAGCRDGYLVRTARRPASPVSERRAVSVRRSQGAGDATLDLGALDRHLPQADVVEGLDALAPGVDLRTVHVAGRGGGGEEQREAEPLIHVLGRRGVRVDDLLVADLVGVLVVLGVLVRHERRRVVHAPDLDLLADLYLRRDGVGRAGRVGGVGDSAGRRDGLEVGVVEPVLGDLGRELAPVVLGGEVDARVLEELAHALGLRLPHLVDVLGEERAVGVLRVIAVVEGLEAHLRAAVRRADG